jgi:hypothetical protein
VIVPPRTAAKQEAEEDWGPVGGPSTLAPGHPHLLEGSFPARGSLARMFSDRLAGPLAPARMPGGLTAPRVEPRVTCGKAEKPQ